MVFNDRRDAGEQLAERLSGEDLHEPVVLALPRGGIPVAAPVASALDVPLQPFVARKVGAPGHQEFGIGAIAEGTDEVVISDAAQQLGISDEQMSSLAADERLELERRVQMYRGGHQLPDLEDRDVVLVDDGLATGVTAEAALKALRRHKPRKLLLAVPVSAPDTARRLEGVADQVICIDEPEHFGAVGNWYRHFEQTTDDEVKALLDDPHGR